MVSSRYLLLSSPGTLGRAVIEADAIDAVTLNALFASFPHLGSRFYRSLALVLSQRLRRTSAELAKAIGPRT